MVPWPIPIAAGSPFTLASLPYGIFSTSYRDKRVGVAIGDFILDLSSLERSSILKAILQGHECGHNGRFIFTSEDLGNFAKVPTVIRKRLRQQLINWLSDPTSPLFQDATLNEATFVPMRDATMHLPFKIGGFSDFMCSDVHVDNCSRLAGAQTPANHYAMPIGYNGRASSVVVESAPVHRPYGLIRDKEKGKFVFKPSMNMDYEAELGIFISHAVPVGKTITADEAEQHIFGFVVLNDCGGSAGAPYLSHAKAESTWDIKFEVSVNRRKSGEQDTILTTYSNLRDLRWSPGQMVAHLASSGCGLNTGDLLGTGTISSPNDTPTLRTLGCLFELTEAGKIPAGQREGSKLAFLEDGDEVVMTAMAAGATVNLGTLRGQLQACRNIPTAP
ncbi:hypothetical protein N7468_000735 [Penicillium chermesinum]|uniref:Fumarylacetoacetase n=1 Tax=Penicillium chermesinum TaxID=63820 RepID=A0A9W9PM66_9EURO|nr:uncharacterized protein N7468_000735 [Penicillium chermesinum]KAJ5249284.1 hypothetical protein N7468_000735 [Penicillium chermesinum]